MPRGRANTQLILEDNEILDNELITNRKITYKLKPFPVQKHLSKKYYDLIKEKEKLECSICYDTIDCKNCFCLLSCSHYYHKECIDDCLSNRCPLCNV